MRFQTARPTHVQYLYHWQRFVPEFLIPLLRKQVIWCSNPAMFNDPWDCKPYFNTDFETDPAQIERHVQKYAEITRRHRPDIPEEYIAHRQKQLRDDPNLIVELINALSQEIWRTISERYRVYCLGPDIGNLLMWSHYADNHKGVCLQFSTRNMVICCAQRVEYHRTFPLMHAHTNDEDENLVPLLTKSEVWNYEQEYRVIAQERGNSTDHETLMTDNNYLKLPDGALTSIIVGCQGSFEEVQELVSSHSKNIPVKRAVRIPNRYALNIE